jgi:hypothetical protein
MNPIISLLRPGDRGPAVADLQDALLLVDKKGTVNLSNPRAIFAGSPPRFTRSRVTYEAYVVSGTSTRPQVDSPSPMMTA